MPLHYVHKDLDPTCLGNASSVVVVEYTQVRKRPKEYFNSSA